MGNCVRSKVRLLAAGLMLHLTQPIHICTFLFPVYPLNSPLSTIQHTPLQVSPLHLNWFHLLMCNQATLPSLTHHFATTSTPELLSTSVASSLTQVMPSLVTSTRMEWWSVTGTWWTQHWLKQSIHPSTRASSCSFSTSNQSMMVSIAALLTQVIQMKRCPVTCTSTDQVRTSWVHEVDGPCV